MFEANCKIVLESMRYIIYKNAVSVDGTTQQCKSNNINSPNWWELHQILLGYFVRWQELEGILEKESMKEDLPTKFQNKFKKLQLKQYGIGSKVEKQMKETKWYFQ